jgi:hypothetical protein
MIRPRMRQQLLHAALSMGVAAMFFAATLPHRHAEGAPNNHQAQSCRACKLHDGFSATPPQAGPLPEAPAREILVPLAPVEVPRTGRSLPTRSPRAPPRLS